MILITGANGQLGRATIDFLLKKVEPQHIVGLVRDPQKAADLQAKGITLKVGDYLDTTSMEAAFKGIKTLGLISSGTIEQRTQQHINAIEIAKKAGVQRIVYTSIISPSPTPYFTVAKDHYETEEYLKTSGVNYTLLQHTFYFEVVPMLLGDALQSGKIYFPAGDGKVALASRIDMAEALAHVLTSSGHGNKAYPIATEVAYSFADIAAMLSEITGKSIEYIDIPLEAMKQTLTQIGLEAGIIELTATIANAIKYGELNHPSPVLEQLLGRKPVSLPEFLRQVVSASR